MMEDSASSAPNICAVINQLRERMKDENDEICGIEVLNDVLCNPVFQNLVDIQACLTRDTSAVPVTSRSFDLIQNVKELLDEHSMNDVLGSLNTLLHSSPHLYGLLSSHDKIASKTFDEPQLSDVQFDESELDDDNAEESMKVVRLVKSDEPLGATIALDEATGNIVIARILKGCAADRSGLIHVNDILVEVNNIPVTGKKPSELIKLLSGLKGPLTFKLIPGEAPLDEKQESMFLRCRFTYLPQADNLIPCVEAGLTFYPGDIVRVVSKDDHLWWQANKIESTDKSKHSNNNRVGLIPSIKLQERREKLRRQTQVKPNNNAASIKGSNISLLSNGRRNAWSVIRASFRRKRHTVTQPNKPDLIKQIPTFPPYEIVSQMDPCCRLSSSDVKIYRPIVLVGPQGVGRNELKDRLIDSNPTHYGVPVPHTSRMIQVGEENGKDYHFVSREYMECGIRENNFLEYGEYKGNLYGTSLEAVRSVIQGGQVCVLTPYPQALTMLHTKEFMPFVVFIKPPSVLEMGRMDDACSTNDGATNLTLERQGRGASFTDEGLRNLVSRAENMEAVYGRLFDATIVNDNTDKAFSQLKELSFFLENDHQWVPSEWL